MRPGIRGRWLVSGTALLACLGVWLGHTIEYVRVWGLTGLSRELTGSVHLYMVPVGLVLTALLAVAVLAVNRVCRALSGRADSARRLLAASWRGEVPVARRLHAPAPLRTGDARRVLALGSALGCVQIALYLVQENLESAIAGVRAPGLAALSGIHWAAPLVHAAVAFVLATLVVATATLLRRQQDRVVRFERAVFAVLAALFARRPRHVLAPTAPLRHLAGLEFLGTSLWCRPPPVALIP